MTKLTLANVGLLLAYGLCRLLPIRWVSNIGAWRGRYRGKQLDELQARVRKNLEQIAPGIDQEAVLRDLRREAGRAALEVLISDRLVKAGCIDWVAHEGFDRAIKEKRSVVFALAHISNLGDVLGGEIGDRFNHFRTCEVVVRNIQNPVMRWIIKRCRARLLGNMPGRVDAPHPGQARRVLQRLKNPPAMLMLHVDEARQQQVPYPRFGRSSVHHEKGINAQYAIRFARKSGACLVPLAMKRDRHDPLKFKVHVLATWDMANEHCDDDVILEQMSRAFESSILHNPAQWLNLYHRRP